MATSYPATKQTFSDPLGTSLVTSPDHASLHTDINDTVEVIQDTVGTTAGTNVLSNFTAGQFPLRVTGGGATGTHITTLVGGTLANTALIGTPQITGGTITNAALIGTSQITGGTITNAALIGTSQITGGTITNAALIGTSQITGGTASSITLGTPVIVGTFIKVGNFTRDLSAASGTVGYTVGFQPRAVDFMGVVNGTFTSSIGYDDGITPSCIAQDAVNVWTYDLTSSIYLQTGAGTRQTGSISSFTATGFIVNWTKTSNPTGTSQFIYKAYR